MEWGDVLTNIAPLVVALIGYLGHRYKLQKELEKASLQQDNSTRLAMNESLDKFSSNFIQRTEDKLKQLDKVLGERNELQQTVAKLMGEIQGFKYIIQDVKALKRERDDLRSELNKFRTIREKLLKRIEGYNLIIVFSTEQNKLGIVSTIIHDDNTVVYGTFSSDFMPKDIALLDKETFKDFYDVKVELGSFLTLDSADYAEPNSLYNKVIEYTEEPNNPNRVKPLIFNFNKFQK